jgi:hypothetical protein
MIVSLALAVSQFDIDTGVARNCNDCPVAMAMLRAARLQWPQYADDLQVRANRASLGIWNTSLDVLFKWYALEVPLQVQAFIEHYDAGRTVAPFAIEVRFKQRGFVDAVTE